MSPNRLKEILNSGRQAFGVALQQLRTPETARILGAAGADFIWMDAEHGMFDFETLQDLNRAAAESGATPLVRVAELSYGLVARALDGGAQGIILPRVEDPEKLREAVSWTKFPPLGKRGFGLGLSQLGYQNPTFAEIIEHRNDNGLCIVQIESEEALGRLPELLSVEGIDIALVGPADLSISLGCPGQFDDPRLIAAIDKVVEACKEHGVAPGIHFRGLQLARQWVDRGMKFISVGTETTLLYEKAVDLFGALRRV